MAIDKKDIKELVVEEYAKAIAEASSLDKIVYDLVTQTTSPTKEKLNEDNAATFPFRIFCDMDGVLVDLIQGIIDEANIRMADKSERQRKSFMKILSSGEEWKNLKTSKQGKEVLKNIFKILGNDRDFWASLPLMSDAN